jgi:hypothetical protein
MYKTLNIKLFQYEEYFLTKSKRLNSNTQGPLGQDDTCQGSLHPMLTSRYMCCTYKYIAAKLLM